MDWLFPLLGASAISSLEKKSNYLFDLRLSLGQVRDPEELLPNVIPNPSVIFLKSFGICLGVVRGVEPRRLSGHCSATCGRFAGLSAGSCRPAP